MNRLAVSRAALLCGLVIAFATHPSLALASPAPATPDQTSGTITTISGSWFTIQISGRRTGVVNAMVDTANALTSRDYSYVWGGGHPQAGVASAVAGAKGRKAKVLGFDCSGSVAAVLAGAGLWPAGGPVPSDAGVISQLLHEKLIARGPGTSPVGVTLYDDPGVHIFMNIDGRFFGTSDGEGAGSGKGGPAWLYDRAPDAFNHTYRQYHVLPSVLRSITTYGQTLTFETGADATLLRTAALGDNVNVTYSPGGSGTMLASALTYVGAITTSGTVTSIAADGSFTIDTPGGHSLTLSTGTSGLSAELAVGAGVEVTYTEGTGELLARSLAVTSSAPPASAGEGSEGVPPTAAPTWRGG